MTLALCLLLAAAQGPVSEWKMDEGSGATTADAVGGNHGTLVGPPAWSLGRVGNALDFNENYVEIPDSNSLTPGTQMTIAAWIYLDAVNEDWDSIVNKWSQSVQEEYTLSVQSSRQLGFAFHTTGSDSWGNSSYNAVTSTGKVPLGGWTHVGVVRDGTSLTFYISGSAAGTGNPMDNNPFRNGSDTLRIGGQNRGGRSRHFDGKIDSVTLHARALSAPEMADLASLPPETDLEAWWKLNGTALDEIDNHHGVLVGNPVWTSGALDLDGDGDYVQVPDRDDLTAGTEATIAAWIHPEEVEDPTGLDVIAAKWAHTSAGDEIFLGLGSDRRPLVAWQTTGSSATWGTSAYYAAQTAQAVPLAAWSHVAFVRRGTAVHIYIDGAEAYAGEPADANPFKNGHRDFRIGAEDSSESSSWGQIDRWFDGMIRDVRYYTRALTTSEVLTLATPTGPVAHWKLDGTPGDAGGIYEGTLVGNPVFESGQVGGAIHLDGEGDYVSVPDADGLTPGTKMTLAAWILPEAVEDATVYQGTALDMIAGKWTNSLNDEYFLGIDTDRKILFAWHTTGGSSWPSPAYNAVLTPATAPLFEWTHVGVVRNGPSVKIYIGGVENYGGNDADGNPFANGTSGFHIGSEDSQESSFWGDVQRAFRGRIDDVRLYARALSAQEMADLAAPPAGLPTVTVMAQDPAASEPSDPGTFVVTRTQPYAGALTVYYTVGGTADPGNDYQTLPGSVVIPNGSGCAPVPVAPIDDPTPENDETVLLLLSTNAAYTVGSPSQATVTIASDDGPPPLPEPPLNVRATPYSNAVDVEWDPSPSPDVAGYNVYRKTGAGGSWGLLNPSGVVLNFQYRDATAVNGTAYVYRVTAVGN